MAAGQGFKTFVTGEVLTSGDVNGYLMQGINVFTNATARDAAITAPAEGQFAFTKDNNSLWYYDGAAWVASGATGDIEGVTAGVGISGGGTSGTVTVTNSMATAIDAKGDLVPGTGADTFSRLAVGANGTVLTADSAEATGLKWAVPAAGSMTLLSTTTLSGATTTISSIDQTYTDLLILVRGITGNTGNETVNLKPNNANNNSYGSQRTGTSDGGINEEIKLTQGGSINRTGGLNSFAITIQNYAGTSYWKPFAWQGVYNDNSPTTLGIYGGGGIATTSGITSLVFLYGGGNTFSGGQVQVYGVK
jgi:hypothetical protein